MNNRAKHTRKRSPASKATSRLTPEQRAYWGDMLDVVPVNVILQFERWLDGYITSYKNGLRKVLSRRKSTAKIVDATKSASRSRRAAERAFDRAMLRAERTGRRRS